MVDPALPPLLEAIQEGADPLLPGGGLGVGTEVEPLPGRQSEGIVYSSSELSRL
jgi:hypothetical protein